MQRVGLHFPLPAPVAVAACEKRSAVRADSGCVHGAPIVARLPRQAARAAVWHATVIMRRIDPLSVGSSRSSNVVSVSGRHLDESMRPLPLLDDWTAPEGFRYQHDFLTIEQEARLLDEIRRPG
jgi:hypothetical protein